MVVAKDVAKLVPPARHRLPGSLEEQVRSHQFLSSQPKHQTESGDINSYERLAGVRCEAVFDVDFYAPYLSIHRPCTRSGEFEQMAVGVTKVEAPAARFPRTFLLHGDPLLLEPRLPVAQFSRWNCEGEVQFPVPVVR